MLHHTKQMAVVEMVAEIDLVTWITNPNNVFVNILQEYYFYRWMLLLTVQLIMYLLSGIRIVTILKIRL
jgi:hypothetical protein